MIDPSVVEKLKWNSQFIMIENNIVVSIRDIHDIWLYDKNKLFNLLYRYAGTKQDMYNILSRYVDNIDDVIDNSLTYENYNNKMLEIYNNELSNYDRWKRATNKFNIDMGGYNIKDLIDIYKPKDELDKKHRYTELLKPRKFLNKRIEKLAIGKVLDVSIIDGYGSNVKTINFPTIMNKTLKFGSPNLPIVSSNIDSYITAIGLIINGKKLYKNDIEYVEKLFNDNKPVNYVYNPIINEVILD